MDPDVTIRRFTRKLFTVLWLKHGLIATFPAPGPTSPRINDISIKVAKSVIVYSYANRHVVQYYMEKHLQQMAQSKISFWTHLSFLCLIIRLHNDHLFDYFLSVCSIITEAALFCNWQKLDDVHTYASTFFEAFFEKELACFFYHAGGWAGLLNYIEDNDLLYAYDLVKPYESDMACPSNHVPVLVRVQAEKLSAERRERIFSSRELKSEVIERTETVMLLSAKIFDWEFTEQLHVPFLKPGVFKRRANIRRKSRGKTISTDLPKPQNSRNGGDKQEAGNPASQMNQFRFLEYSAVLHSNRDFHRSISVGDSPSTESTSNVSKDEVFHPLASVYSNSTSSSLVTSSWFKLHENKYERHRRQSGTSKSTSIASSKSSRDSTSNQTSQTDFSPTKELTCSETSLKYKDSGDVSSSSVPNINIENEVVGLDIRTMTSTNLSSGYDYIEENYPNTLNANGKSEVEDLNSAQIKTCVSSLIFECDDCCKKRNLNVQNIFREDKAIDFNISNVETNTNSSNCISSKDDTLESQTALFLKDLTEQIPAFSGLKNSMEMIRKHKENLSMSTKQECSLGENKLHKVSDSKFASKITDVSTRNKTKFLEDSPTSSKQPNSNASFTKHSETEHSTNKSLEMQTSSNKLCTKHFKGEHLNNRTLEMQTYSNASFMEQSKNEHSITEPLEIRRKPNACYAKQFKAEHSSIKSLEIQTRTNAPFMKQFHNEHSIAKQLKLQMRPNAFTKQSETQHSSNASSEKTFKEVIKDDVETLSDVKFPAELADASVIRNLNSNYRYSDPQRRNDQPVDFAEDLKSVVIGPNQTVHYKKRIENFYKTTRELNTETGSDVKCLESSNGNNQSSIGISEENILLNSGSTESRSEWQSDDGLCRDSKTIERLVNRLKKMGVSDPVVFKI